MSLQQAAPVLVEVLALRVVEGGLAYRVLSAALAERRHPDEVARDLLGLSRHSSEHLLHSTSWRHEPDGTVVLTYACCPDPQPEASAVALRERVLARGTGPASPSPETVQIRSVAAHAARHLSFLVHTDPDARRVIRSVPGLASALGAWSPAPAGQLPGGGGDRYP